MKILSRDELKLLMDNRADPSVSLYMPAHPVSELEQDPIRLKNLLREAEEQLIAYGIRATDARSFLKPAQLLLPDMWFWQHQGNGLAVFISPRLFRYHRTPFSFDELVVVSRHFHLKPLIPLFSEDGVFYILAISQGKVRLLQCTRYYVRDVTPEHVPANIDVALQYDEPLKQFQYHTTGRGGITVSHGQGIGKDEDKVNILRYFQQVDSGLQEILHDEHVPLVLAAVDYLHPLYRQANSYRYLLEKGIQGNPDGMDENILHDKGWEIVQPYFERVKQDARERYNEGYTKGLASSDIEQALIAAYDGRVGELFVATDQQKWGIFDQQTRKIERFEREQPGIDDLLDVAAMYTLASGGSVYAVATEEIPDNKELAALYRY